MVQLNDELWATYKDSNQIKFKTLLIKSSSCDFSDAYRFVSGTITIKGEGDDDDTKKKGIKK